MKLLCTLLSYLSLFTLIFTYTPQIAVAQEISPESLNIEKQLKMVEKQIKKHEERGTLTEDILKKEKKHH